jgi:hypothetical protein
LRDTTWGKPLGGHLFRDPPCLDTISWNIIGNPLWGTPYRDPLGDTIWGTPIFIPLAGLPLRDANCGTPAWGPHLCNPV